MKHQKLKQLKQTKGKNTRRKEMLVDLCKEVFEHTVNNHNDIDQFKALVRDLSNVTFQTKQANKFKFLQLKIIIKNF